MKTINLEKTLRGLSVWLLSKSGYLLYLLCTGLPILFYIVCLLLITVKMEASITLSIIMAAMINPLVTIPIGVAMKTTSQFLISILISNQPVSRIVVIFLRLFTYSLNCHLTLIAGLTYYLFMVWIDSEQSSEINFSNLPYDQCLCDVLTDLELDEKYCFNWENDSSFQNQLVSISLPLILQMFLFTSFTCHLIHSLIIYIPLPLTLINFYVGLNQDNAKSIARISRPRNNLRHSLAKLGVRINIFKTSCCFIAILYMVALASSPYYGFNLFLASSANENGNPVCQKSIGQRAEFTVWAQIPKALFGHISVKSALVPLFILADCI